MFHADIAEPVNQAKEGGSPAGAENNCHDSGQKFGWGQRQGSKSGCGYAHSRQRLS